MKLAFRDIEAFVKKPNPAARVCIIYGPDQGLVVERAQNIAKTKCPDLNDPFNVTRLSADALLADPARLNDEAFAGSLMGGDRLIYITSGTDGLTPLLKEYLTAPSPHTLVVIEAGELGTKSSLRQLAEKAKNAAAIPCYVEDERDLKRFFETEIRNAGFTIDYDAMATLASNLVGDRRVARGEFEKLLTYKWNDQTKKITLADVEACAGDVRASTFDELIHATGLGQVDKAMTALSTLFRENTAPISILRTLQRHFKRLYDAHLKIESGADHKAAMKSLHPPVFFKYESAFSAQINRWPRPHIERYLTALNEIEAKTKQTGMPPETLTANIILRAAMRRAR